MSQSVKGRPDWELKAATAVLDEKAKEAALAAPEMHFYRERKLVSRLSALSGAANTETRDIRLSSSVVVTSLEDRSVLRTEQLDFSSAKNKFFTDKDVLVTRPGGALRGRGMQATPDLSEITIFHQRTVIEERRNP